MSQTVPFTLLSAFATTPYTGNPAAIFFPQNELPVEKLMGIARNINQPMTVAKFGVRFFTSKGTEVPLCGHGTLAAAKAVFDQHLVSEEVETIEFQTVTRGVVATQRLEGGQFEMLLPSSFTEELSPSEYTEITPMIRNAFGREVAINYMGRGGAGFREYLLIELDEKENLGACSVNADALVKSIFKETGYVVHTITTSNSSGDALFVSRMFAPTALQDEDPVCGSAHCLLTPYWQGKKGIQAKQLVKAKQVSPRGGDLTLRWDDEKELLSLRGNVVVIAHGEIVS
ncbi:hypothetical protein BD779DRAFT_1607693 [Infundibulicybe gibba]|nr:hypothetical protein BD779DRAFT_1607693 [Infundibulicybe gibba]